MEVAEDLAWAVFHHGSDGFTHDVFENLTGEIDSGGETHFDAGGDAGVDFHDFGDMVTGILNEVDVPIAPPSHGLEEADGAFHDVGAEDGSGAAGGSAVNRIPSGFVEDDGALDVAGGVDEDFALVLDVGLGDVFLGEHGAVFRVGLGEYAAELFLGVDAVEADGARSGAGLEDKGVAEIPADDIVGRSDIDEGAGVREGTLLAAEHGFLLVGGALEDFPVVDSHFDAGGELVFVLREDGGREVGEGNDDIDAVLFDEFEEVAAVSGFLAGVGGEEAFDGGIAGCVAELEAGTVEGNHLDAEIVQRLHDGHDLAVGAFDEKNGEFCKVNHVDNLSDTKSGLEPSGEFPACIGPCQHREHEHGEGQPQQEVQRGRNRQGETEVKGNDFHEILEAKGVDVDDEGLAGEETTENSKAGGENHGKKKYESEANEGIARPESKTETIMEVQDQDVESQEGQDNQQGHGREAERGNRPAVAEEESKEEIKGIDADVVEAEDARDGNRYGGKDKQDEQEGHLERGRFVTKGTKERRGCIQDEKGRKEPEVREDAESPGLEERHGKGTKGEMSRAPGEFFDEELGNKHEQIGKHPREEETERAFGKIGRIGPGGVTAGEKTAGEEKKSQCGIMKRVGQEVEQSGGFISFWRAVVKDDHQHGKNLREFDPKETGAGRLRDRGSGGDTGHDSGICLPERASSRGGLKERRPKAMRVMVAMVRRMIWMS